MEPVLPSPLALEGWHEFNRIKWGVRPHRVAFGQSEGDGARLDAVLYLNRRGRVYLPDDNPYLPVWFRPSPTSFPSRSERRWLTLAEQLADEMRARGMANAVDLPVGIMDGRPWRWAGFSVGAKYTYVVDLPYSPERMEKNSRSQLRRAERAGYRCERTDRLADAHVCLVETAARKGFRLDLSLRDLETARELLGDEHLRVYVCYGPDGMPAAANIVLHRPGGMALGWLGGVTSAHLSAGAFQLLEVFSMDDLAAAGASRYDLAGANIPGVARAKSQFGGRLTPYYFVNPVGLKPLAIWILEWLRPARDRARRNGRCAAAGAEVRQGDAEGYECGRRPLGAPLHGGVAGAQPSVPDRGRE